MERLKTRDAILNHARQLFAKQGFEQTSMSDIAKKSGIEKASLYYFYKDKEDIFAQVMVDLWTNTATKFHETLEKSSPKASKQAHLAKVLEIVMEAVMQGGLTLTKLDNCKRKVEPQYREMFKHINSMKVWLKDFLKREGVPKPDLAEEVIGNAIHAYVIHAQCEKPKVSVKNYANYLSSMFLNSNN